MIHLQPLLAGNSGCMIARTIKTKLASCTASAAECMTCVSPFPAAKHRCCAGQHAARASWSQMARIEWVVEQGSTACRGGEAGD